MIEYVMAGSAAKSSVQIQIQGSRSARLSPQSMIHYTRKLFKCSIRIVQCFTILETTR